MNSGSFLFKEGNSYGLVTSSISNKLNNIKRIPSPDLNPIETVWRLMKDKINDLLIRPSPIPDVIAVVESIWNSLDLQIDILPHIISLPTRIKAVIEANGGHKILVVLGFFIYLFIYFVFDTYMQSVISYFLLCSS